MTIPRTQGRIVAKVPNVRITSGIVLATLVMGLAACGNTSNKGAVTPGNTPSTSIPNTSPARVVKTNWKAEDRAALRGFDRSVNKAQGSVWYSWRSPAGELVFGIDVVKSRDESTTTGIVASAKFDNGSCIAPVRLSVAADGEHYRYDLGAGDTDCPLEGNTFPDVVSWEMDSPGDDYDVMPFHDYREIANAKHVEITFTGVAGTVKTFPVSSEVLDAMRKSIAGARW